MSRNLSAPARRALFAPETDEAFLILLTLAHPSLETPLRVTSDSVETVSRGHAYAAYPFELSLPDDDDGRPPRARIAIDNIDRVILAALRTITSAATVTIEIVRGGAPDTVEAVFYDFRLVNLVYDSQKITGELSLEDFTAEPYPAASFSPSLFPALF